MTDLFHTDPPPNRWADKPASCKACVYAAIVRLGLFDGKEVWLDALLSEAQMMRRVRSGYANKPSHETLGRTLRGRGVDSTQVEVHDYLAGCGWQVVEEHGKIRLERSRG